MLAVSKQAIEKATGTLWPRRSLISGDPVGDAGDLAPSDFTRLTFIGGALCDSCGTPGLHGNHDRAICPACHANQPKWRRARAALVYDDVSSKPILSLKRAGKRDGLKVMGRWMARASEDVLGEVSLITPVPLHRRRLAQRGYNQAVWLGAEMARQTALPFAPALIKRKKATPSQGHLSASARKRNVAGAFDISEKSKTRIKGRDILLVDDVLTTGATAEACAKALLKAGAANVDVVTVARVVRESDVTI